MSQETKEIVTVLGYIRSLNFQKTLTTFNIITKKSGKKYSASVDFFCPLREGDLIEVECIMDGNHLSLISSPLTIFSMDEESVTQTILKGTKLPFIVSKKIFNKIKEAADQSDLEVIDYLNSAADSVNKSLGSERSKQYISVIPHDLYRSGNKSVQDYYTDFLRWWYKERNLRALYLFGFNKKEINACKMMATEIYKKCVNNPLTIPAITMEKAVKIIRIIKKTITENDLICGQIIREIWRQSENGWSSMPYRMLIRKFPQMENLKDILIGEYDCVFELDCVYLKNIYLIEKEISDYIIKIRKEDPISYDTPLDTPLETFLERKSVSVQDEITEEQTKAIQGALDHRISIITGGAGTGKTTCIRQIVLNLEERGFNYLLTSFTGKAVSRIREVTNKRTAYIGTMHSLMSRRAYITNPPLYVIMDEASMITEELFYDFIASFSSLNHIILVGDSNQLPPIGWGSLFYQLIISETIPVYHLTENKRVYEDPDMGEDGIILNANGIISVTNTLLPYEFQPTNNFVLIEDNIQRVSTTIKRFNEQGIKPKNVIVLSPYNEHLDQINQKIQEIYDKGEKFHIDQAGNKWRINDLVILGVNINEKNLANGDIGVIIAIDKNGTDDCIYIDFGAAGIHAFNLLWNDFSYTEEGRIVKKNDKYDTVIDGQEAVEEDFSVRNLKLAYCLTIDKSQGSEWDYVIFWVPSRKSGNFFNKNRIYTAITRAKRFVVVLGDLHLLYASSSKKLPYRCENLDKRLKDKLKNIPPLKKKSGYDLYMEDLLSGYEVPEGEF